MKPDNNWTSDWKIGANPSREKQLSKDILKIFVNFWTKSELDKKSKPTKNRYSSALHSIGGYLIESGTFEDNTMTAEELLLDSITSYEGPHIHHDNSDWQYEVNLVSRKLYKFMKT